MKHKGVLVTAAVAAAIVLIAAIYMGAFRAPDALTGFWRWSDAFFVAGVIVGGAGLLSFSSSDGLFDIIRFGVGKVLRIALSKEKQDAYPKTFYEYRQQRHGQGTSGLSIALVGLVCIALGGLFLWFYFQESGAIR